MFFILKERLVEKMKEILGNKFFNQKIYGIFLITS